MEDIVSVFQCPCRSLQIYASLLHGLLSLEVFPLRIEQAMEQIHYSIDPFKDAEEQAKDIIKLLRSVLPIKTEQVSVSVRIPPEFAGKAYGVIKGFGTIKHEEWRGDGSFHAIVEMPAGLYGPFLEKLGGLTKGAAEAKLIE